MSSAVRCGLSELHPFSMQALSECCRSRVTVYNDSASSTYKVAYEFKQPAGFAHGCKAVDSLCKLTDS